jgi:threonine aldolase
MRQAGIIAAAGLFALKNNIQRLKIDHDNAKYLAEILSHHIDIKSIYPVSTNIVIAETKEDNGAATFVEEMKSQNILCFPFGVNKVRFVTHLGIQRADIDAHFNYILTMVIGTSTKD